MLLLILLSLFSSIIIITIEKSETKSLINIDGIINNFAECDHT